MTPRERVLTAMSRRVPDRVPKDLSWGLSPAAKATFREKTGSEDYLDYFGIETRVVGLELSKGWGSDYVSPSWETETKDGDFLKYLGDVSGDIRITEWGTGHVRGSMHHFTKPLFPMAQFESVREVEEYPFPTFSEAGRRLELVQKVEKFHRRDLAVMGGLACTIFEVSWQLRGMEQLFLDFSLNPEFAELLLDRVAEIRCGMARTYARAGVDILVLGDDVAGQRGMLMSLPTWRRWFRGRLARVIEAAKSVDPNLLIFYHSDGNPEEVIPDLIDIGVDILNPLQPECVDPERIKNRYGNELAFWGAISIQKTMPFGTVRDVKDEVKRRMETVGRGGGFLIGPTHVIEPEVPWENILAFFEAVEEYGRYD